MLYTVFTHNLQQSWFVLDISIWLVRFYHSEFRMYDIWAPFDIKSWPTRISSRTVLASFSAYLLKKHKLSFCVFISERQEVKLFSGLWILLVILKICIRKRYSFCFFEVIKLVFLKISKNFQKFSVIQKFWRCTGLWTVCFKCLKVRRVLTGYMYIYTK